MKLKKKRVKKHTKAKVIYDWVDESFLLIFFIKFNCGESARLVSVVYSKKLKFYSFSVEAQDYRSVKLNISSWKKKNCVSHNIINAYDSYDDQGLSDEPSTEPLWSLIRWKNTYSFIKLRTKKQPPQRDKTSNCCEPWEYTPLTSEISSEKWNIKPTLSLNIFYSRVDPFLLPVVTFICVVSN